MEYHVRPYPQQPKRDNAQLLSALSDLEKVVNTGKISPEQVKDFSKRLYEATKQFNDDLIVDQLRVLLADLEHFLKSNEGSEKIAKGLIKIRVHLKRLGK